MDCGANFIITKGLTNFAGYNNKLAIMTERSLKTYNSSI